MKISGSIALKFGAVSGAGLALTVVLLTAMGALNVRQQAVDAFEQSSQSRISQADESLDVNFREVEQNLNYLVQTPQIQAADPSITNYLTHGGQMTPDTNGPIEKDIFSLLKHFGDTHPNLRYLDVGTRWGGYVQWPIESLNGEHYDPRERPWYKAAMTDPEHVVRPAPYLSAAGSGGAIIPFARVVKDGKGEIIGVLEGDISLEDFARLTNGIRFGDTGYLLVTDSSGKILIDPRDKSHEFKALKELGAGYGELAAAADGLSSVSMDGVSYRSYVYTSPKNGWKYYALVPEAQMMAAANRLTLELIVTGLVVLALSLFVTIVLARRMTQPMRALAGSMREIAAGDGDLTRRLPVVSSDEAGHLAGQFNAFVEKLHGVLVQVAASTHHFELAAAEVSAGNTDLSSRTEQQAAALEETASSMTQLTETVKQNADNAREANAMASRATGIADAGNGAMQDMVDTIGRISGSSTRISEITGVIEGIAFQTNILALNAAVEAARAGEQGRGFAVVASEVRSLAQRSAAAAKEIKELISSSVEMIQDGARQANEAGATIAEVKTAIKQVSDIVGEITAASEEQSRGLEQVSQAVGQMDSVTQQNAALVEEAAAASHSLQEQAVKLKQAVSAFRISASHDGARSATVSRRAPATPRAMASKPQPKPKPKPRNNANGHDERAAKSPSAAQESTHSHDDDWQTF